MKPYKIKEYPLYYKVVSRATRRQYTIVNKIDGLYELKMNAKSWPFYCKPEQLNRLFKTYRIPFLSAAL